MPTYLWHLEEYLRTSLEVISRRKGKLEQRNRISWSKNSPINQFKTTVQQLTLKLTLTWLNLVTKSEYNLFLNINSNNSLRCPCLYSNHPTQAIRSTYLKCSVRSIKVQLPALLGNYDRPTNRATDMRVHGEVTLSISNTEKLPCAGEEKGRRH